MVLKAEKYLLSGLLRKCLLILALEDPLWLINHHLAPLPVMTSPTVTPAFLSELPHHP